MVEIKGSVINDSINAVKLRSGEEMFKKILDQLNTNTRKIFERPIISHTDWYPLDAFLQYLEADLKLTANGDENELIKRSEELIEKQLRGIYKVFVKLGSPEFIINRVSLSQHHYLKGLTIESNLIEPEKARVKYIGFEKQHSLIGFSIIGYYKKALEISGAKNVKVSYITKIEEGKGFCELEIEWARK
jgi:hypothetical protein